MPGTGKHIPMRKCMGCNEMIEKNKMLRVVKSPEGAYAIDTTQKASGRGAYICKSQTCFQKVQKQRGLERSFHGAVPQSVYEELRKGVENE